MVENPITEDVDPSKAERAMSFGGIAKDYDRWRPGPSPEVASWLVPERVERVVDLGAGTGAMTRLLVEIARDVVAVEPDARMRKVLAANVPSARVLEGRGEDIPLENASVDAVVVSSAWHWMDTDATITEIARVLRSGGALGVVWAGVDWRSSELAPMRRLIRRGEASTGDSSDSSPKLGTLVDQELPSARRTLTIADHAPFERPVYAHLEWKQNLSADEIIGMLGTFSRVVVLPVEQKAQIFDTARQLLRDHAGAQGEDVLELPFRAECWRAVRS